MPQLLRAATFVAVALSVLLIAPIGIGGTPSAEAARRGVDISPPAVGSCHDLTFDEAMAFSDPDPAVDCTAEHTSVTVKVVKFAKRPDWTDGEALYRRWATPCYHAELALFDGKAKSLQLSVYDVWLFFPTKAQREAGAKWVRCDVVLPVGRSLASLPADGDPKVGALPHPDDVARCRAGKARDYLITACTGPHVLRATYALKHPGSYPGLDRIKKWTNRRCSARLGRAFGYYQVPTLQTWRAGLRYSVCYRKTTS